MDLPSRDECLRILRENGCDAGVIAHCEAVCALAVKVARLCGAHVQLVEAGAMLHDLGRCRTHSIRHAVEGAEMARELGLQEEVVRIIERHIGGGLREDDAEALGLGRNSYMPETLEERIVAHSDNLFDGVARIDARTAVAELTRRGLGDAARRVIELHRDLSRMAKVDLDRVA